MYNLLTGKSVSDGEVFQGASYLVDGATIVNRNIENAEDFDTSKAETIDLRGYTVMPGLIDIHVHGAVGHDVMDATYEALLAISDYKIQEGCTSFCPTTLTAPANSIIKAVKNVKEAMQKGVHGAKMIGVFLEGPYINSNFRGAHQKEYIRQLDLESAKELINAGDGCVSSIAIAPEYPGAIEAIKDFVQMGIQVRIGHSAATVNEAEAALAAGANMVIHTFNAMSPFHHRQPGIVGAVLTNDDVVGELICDLVHVHPTACKALAKVKGGDGIALVTDCMAAGGLPDGEHRLGNQIVQVMLGVSRLQDGVLAGSTTTMIDSIRHMHRVVGVPLEESVQMATATPAKSLGIFDKIGSLDVGKHADIIAVDNDFKVVFVMVDGVIKKQP